MPVNLDVERIKVRDYFNDKALYNWVRPLNGPKCTHDPTKVNPSFRINRNQQQDWYSVWTEWKITATKPLPNNDYSRALILEIFLFGDGYPHGPLSYEIRIGFRNPPGLLPTEIGNIRQTFNPLFQQEGFANNGPNNGYQDPYPIDISKRFNKPPIAQNIIPDIELYIGPLHNNGQHLEPYIRSVINAL